MVKRAEEILKDLAVTMLLLAAATAAGEIFRRMGLHSSNVVIVYVLSVLLTARLTKGHCYGLLASIASFLLFNWFYTEPFYSLKINDPGNIVTVVIMTVTATITSALTTKVKQAAAEAREKEAESNALYQLTNHLTDAENDDAIGEIAVRTVSEIFSCRASCIIFDEEGAPLPAFIQMRSDGQLVHRELAEGEELRRRMETLHVPVEVGTDSYDYPIYGADGMLGILRIPAEVGENLTDAQNRMIHSIIESTALAMERYRSLQAQARSREETTQERYRGNLLRAISHDLRTPLSGIMGTSEMLMGMTEKEDPRYDLAEAIYKDADWLHALVENILNLTKFQDGRLILNKEPQAVEEVIGAALMVMEKRMPGRKIEVSIPDNVVMAPMDGRLITQVLVNLLDNAVKHTPEGREIAIAARVAGDMVRFTVSDQGTGIQKKDLPHLFQMFYTTGSSCSDARPGVGLGLAICQSIVEAHGGTISAENRPEGGARFIFTIPMEETAHES